MSRSLTSLQAMLLGLVVIVGPTAVLMGSLGDSVQTLAMQVKEGKLEVPAPSESVAGWPAALPGRRHYYAGACWRFRRCGEHRARV